MWALCTSVALLLSTTYAAPASNEHDVDIRMPFIQPSKPDTYMCYAKKMGNIAEFITSFTPHAKMGTAHHVLLYGCEEPGDDKDEAWNCGEMAASETSEEIGPVCKTGQTIVYAWARDAPALKLPKDVAYKVGGDSKVKYLVLQVHYMNVSKFLPPLNEKDHSGLTLHMTEKPQPKRMGIYLLGTGGEIPPHSVTYMETACGVSSPVPTMHPFAFRVHTHQHGKVVSGFRVRNGKWELIGKADPMKPQMFYPVANPSMDISGGDVLAARCTMKNDEDRSVSVGTTHNDEMCNFYVMYYVDGKDLPKDNSCFTAGPPSWNWEKEGGLLGAPNLASMLPGGEFLKQSMGEFENRINAVEEAMDHWFDEEPNDEDERQAEEEREEQEQAEAWLSEQQYKQALRNRFYEKLESLEDELTDRRLNALRTAEEEELEKAKLPENELEDLTQYGQEP